MPGNTLDLMNNNPVPVILRFFPLNFSKPDALVFVGNVNTITPGKYLTTSKLIS